MPGKRDYPGQLPMTVAEIGRSPNRGRPIEFLTRGESLQWLATRGLVEDPIDSGPEYGYFQFVPQPLSTGVRDLVSAMVEELGSFGGGLLLLTDWIWDDDYEIDPTEAYRDASNESRSLRQVPGFLFAPENLQQASDLMALVIERGWTGRLYFATGMTVLQLCDGYKVDVYTKDPDVERRFRYRLITLGATLSEP